ncbi:hypothetical protein AVEN_194764-1 [Araneus ventricosus]|uniref:Uncharacterized protein n=1 Tax=Araneus ventricosus TaxID=182803 RepID=A0A4Y2B5B2_ARAVE|nr:hypothetical protein AVEN_194764-1 [Araneus ventricosus]
MRIGSIARRLGRHHCENHSVLSDFVVSGPTVRGARGSVQRPAEPPLVDAPPLTHPHPLFPRQEALPLLLWTTEKVSVFSQREGKISASTGVGHSKVHLYLSGSDSDSDKEAADMGSDHQKLKLSSQQSLRKWMILLSFPQALPTK